MRSLTTASLLFIAFTAPSFAGAQAPTPDEAAAMADMKAFQEDIAPGKQAFIAEQLNLSAEEGGRFWPVYQDYQTALSRFNQRRLDNILAYARAWNAGSIDDATAATLAKEAIAIEKAEAAELEKTFKRLQRVVPAAKAAKYLQIETKLRAIVRFEQAAQVPYVK